MTEEPPRTRRTRFVCLSDTHNASPDGAFKLPKGDVLIHAGDLTNQGSFSELQKTVRWLEAADFEAKIVVAGNHDVTLDDKFYAEHGSSFHNQNPQDPVMCKALLAESSSITWLRHESAIIKLDSQSGPHTTFNVFGSPWSPASGKWAFGYQPSEAAQMWESIPLDSDIVITHTPPKSHCDMRADQVPVGCDILRETLWKVRPRLAVCGHVHESRGVHRVKWDLDETGPKYQESSVHRWLEPGKGNKKLSLVDLTTRGGDPISNDGTKRGQHYEPGASVTGTNASVSLMRDSDASASVNGPDTLVGRLSRKETCIVNAAIMAVSWPHGPRGKKFNKPIVVDLDLPVW